MAETGTLRLRFPVVDSAVDWLKQHRRELLVGTIVVIAGVAFVIASGGTGLLVLVPAVLLTSSGVSYTHPFAQVDQ